jgi:hypothetical protein
VDPYKDWELAVGGGVGAAIHIEEQTVLAAAGACERAQVTVLRATAAQLVGGSRGRPRFDGMWGLPTSFAHGGCGIGDT